MKSAFRSSASLGACLAMAAVLAGQAEGAVFAEVGDAGETLATAQATSGASPLDAITGTIEAPGDVDLFLIYISNPAVFSATTVGTGGNLADTQLFLFNSSGLGVYANDDSVGVRSTLPAGLAIGPQTAGLYYLGISAFDSNPVSAGGLIFPNNFSDVVGPTGAGGGSPLLDFNNDLLSNTGTYRINLTGADVSTAAAVPEPSTFALVSLGLAGLAWRARRRTCGAALA